MPVLPSLVSAFPKGNRDTYHQVISDLWPYMSGRFLIEGSAAVRYGIELLGGIPPRHPLLGLRIAIDGLASCRSGLRAHFFVHHLHTSRRSTEFALVLVHRSTNTVVSVGPWPAVATERLLVPSSNRESPGFEFLVPVREPNAQFACSVRQLQLLVSRGVVLSAEIDDLQLLRPHVHMEKAESVWLKLWETDSVPPLQVVYRHLLQSRGEETSSSSQASIVQLECSACRPLPGWVLASKGDICRRLGTEQYNAWKLL